MTPHEENWLALSLVTGVGGRTARQLLQACGTVEAVLDAPPEALCRSGGIGPNLARRIHGARQSSAFAIEARLIRQHQAWVLACDDPRYPEPLKELALAPPLLYGKGELPGPGPWLGVVGTRQHSRYGEKVTRGLIEELARLAPDAVVVSGLARGIDTIAHEQALASGLRTVAVMAGGLTDVYPPENRDLAARIAAQGMLVTEFPMTQQPLARNFPIRNRVIAGLSVALLVVEAGESSGALITAGFAGNYGRALCAVPGNLDQPTSSGVNRLIQSGRARLIASAADLLAALRRPVHGPAQQLSWLEPAPAAPATRARALEGEKARIAESLADGPRHPDDLAQSTGLPVEQVLGLLLELELSGDIVQTPDHHFSLA
jgi:DNA processing protein